MIYAGDGGVGDVDSDSDGRCYGHGHDHDHACFQSIVSLLVVVGYNFANRRNLDIERPSYANLNRLIGQVYNDIRIFVTNKQSLYIDRDFLSLVMKGPSCPPGGLLHHHLPPLRRGAQRRPDGVPDQPGALPKVQASKKS